MDYAAGGWLSSVVDPRDKVVLAAAWTDARVRRIRVLHETTDFAYADSVTTATNLLGWATVYRRAESGITTSITDRTGATTEVVFNADHRPTTVKRDGVPVARISYDGGGRFLSLWQPAGETAITTNTRGEVTAASGAWTASYRYAGRRIVHASDDGGVREYRYDEDGSLIGVTVDGIDTGLRTNADGTLAGMSRDGRALASFAYGPGGRVSSIDYGGERVATFAYDARGFRTSGNYTYGTEYRIDAAMSYDASGNLVGIERGAAGGERTEQTYTVGDYNEVLRVRTDDSTMPDLSFEYDAAGRMYRATYGPRTATVEYDPLDRVTRLEVDGDAVLEHHYGDYDVDAAERDDDRTGGVLVAVAVSPVFGTMESIVYARPRSTEFGVVAYSPTRKTFEARPDALAGDALLLASLQSRMVPLTGGEPNPAPYGHDKPSNSLFIPAEFSSVNCELCRGLILAVELVVTAAGTHCPTEYTATFDGFCEIDPIGWFAPIGLGVPQPLRRRTYFGDDASSSEVTSRREVSGSYRYQTPDEHTMSHFIQCLCPSVFASGSTSVTFNVPGGSESCRPTVKVDSADVVRDEIKVTLRPRGSSGVLNVWLMGKNGLRHRVSKRVAAGGSHVISFGIASVPTGEYSRVKATWTVGAHTPEDSLLYGFRVLGNYRHTQYNTPSEEKCTGPQRSAYVTEVTDSQCTFTATTLKSDFIEEVNENGSGSSINHGGVAREAYCLSGGPADAAERSFRSNHTITGACRAAVGNSTIAVNPLHRHLSCGDSVYIDGVGVKTVTDFCAGCADAY